MKDIYHITNNDKLDIKKIDKFSKKIKILFVDDDENVLINFDNDNITFPSVKLENNEDINYNEITRYIFNKYGYVIYEKDYKYLITEKHYEKVVDKFGNKINKLNTTYYFSVNFKNKNLKKQVNDLETDKLFFIHINDLELNLKQFIDYEINNREDLIEIMSVLQMYSSTKFVRKIWVLIYSLAEIAQLVEHLNRNQEVAGSIPAFSTINIPTNFNRFVFIIKFVYFYLLSYHKGSKINIGDINAYFD